MARTSLVGRTAREKLNSMAVDLITVTPDITEATYSNGDLMCENINLGNATAVTGGTCILQSIVAVDTSDTGGSIYVIITDTAATDLGTVGSAINAADAVADNSVAIVELSNWTDIGGAKVCTKTNIGAVMQSTTDSRNFRIGVVNVSGGDIVIGSGEDIIFKFGVVKD
tara:strand:+ start:1341 stop:1847 length:507 start_codon:yes stop_codon:yes gene_type:complete